MCIYALAFFSIERVYNEISKMNLIRCTQRDDYGTTAGMSQESNSVALTDYRSQIVHSPTICYCTFERCGITNALAFA